MSGPLSQKLHHGTQSVGELPAQVGYETSTQLPDRGQTPRISVIVRLQLYQVRIGIGKTRRLQASSNQKRLLWSPSSALLQLFSRLFPGLFYNLYLALSQLGGTMKLSPSNSVPQQCVLIDSCLHTSLHDNSADSW